MWKIDESKPAIRFSVLSRPVDTLTKVAVRKPSSELSDVRKLQLEWWQTFRDALRKSKAVPSVQTPRPQGWYNVALGKAGMIVSNTANTFDHKIGVRLYLRHKYGGSTALNQLLESKGEIERELDTQLLWNPNPNGIDKIIAVYRDADLREKDQWPEHCEWMVTMTKRFREVFGPRIKELTLEVSDDEDSGATAETPQP